MRRLLLIAILLGLLPDGLVADETIKDDPLAAEQDQDSQGEQRRTEHESREPLDVPEELVYAPPVMPAPAAALPSFEEAPPRQSYAGKLLRPPRA